MSNLSTPLYITAICPKTKQFMLGGIFKMQDQIGFPIDASFEECKAHGYVIDWLEALADCWLNDCLKFDSFVRQANNLTGINLEEKFKQTGALVIVLFPKIKKSTNPVDIACKYILARKKLGQWKLKGFEAAGIIKV